MRIEAHGGFQSPKKETRPLRFCCTNCHCKFVANPGEYIEGKKNTNAIASKDPRPRTKIYVSVCPECNEVVLLPGSCARFIGKPLTSWDIFNLTGNSVKVVSKRPDIPSGIYKIVDCNIAPAYKNSELGQIEARLELRQDNLNQWDHLYFYYDSCNSKGIEFYVLDEE